LLLFGLLHCFIQIIQLKNNHAISRLPEGQTHHEKDSCYKCNKCGGHYYIKEEMKRDYDRWICCSVNSMIDSKKLQANILYKD